MTQLKNRSALLRTVKLLAFFGCLLLMLLVTVVLFFVNREKTEAEFTWSAFLTGTYFEELFGESGLLQRDLFYDNQTSPTILLSGDQQVFVETGTNAYTEPGYSAHDALGNDLTAAVESYIQDDYLFYTVTDAVGNSSSAARYISYTDTTPPEITLTGGNEVTITAGQEFVDPGYSAYDHSDGDMTSRVRVVGSIEKFKLGDYTYTYTATDKYGNQTVVERVVHVEAAPQVETVMPDTKAVYLTFDDGPGPHTEHLLEILDQYNVKVTFFVCANDPDYLYLIGEAYQRGHSIAIHSYTHDYSDIYSSIDNYFDDFNRMQDIVVEETGKETTLVRFPGGSSNTVSANYCDGIMTELAGLLENMGYQYFDWNVTSGDAGETTYTETVVSNVIYGIESNGDEPSIVLQHDIKDFSVDAVEEIIVWGLENGYTFLPLDSSSPAVHHGINN